MYPDPYVSIRLFLHASHGDDSRQSMVRTNMVQISPSCVVCRRINIKTFRGRVVEGSAIEVTKPVHVFMPPGRSFGQRPSVSGSGTVQVHSDEATFYIDAVQYAFGDLPAVASYAADDACPEVVWVSGFCHACTLHAPSNCDRSIRSNIHVVYIDVSCICVHPSVCTSMYHI